MAGGAVAARVRKGVGVRRVLSAVGVKSMGTVGSQAGACWRRLSCGLRPHAVGGMVWDERGLCDRFIRSFGLYFSRFSPSAALELISASEVESNGPLPLREDGGMRVGRRKDAYFFVGRAIVPFALSFSIFYSPSLARIALGRRRPLHSRLYGNTLASNGFS